ncbi:MAG: hypothetical protein NWE99_05555 [Candidatus Bathyarchaeota archaeon]|nr:hypothetical protein [Candidatus Bathyarchaeota archaeon]
MEDDAVIIMYLAAACSIVFCLLAIFTKKRGACEWDLEFVWGSNPRSATMLTSTQPIGFAEALDGLN